ncbi:uncharacterized protein ACHE_31154S [Aspergillus chevalieri]|uniref:Uncharacterized protein n=1 Tax=Aspergillus chevalieri TaxID=182096 RepID=A0A7R7ZNE0_ASPCH|nr:uncharacterized protein ACHE_31154S [Aspergillus chevalieri]BCR87167.1 hypothetical protein ACHE_31154S [Aspergillus chevalieri]
MVQTHCGLLFFLDDCTLGAEEHGHAVSTAGTFDTKTFPQFRSPCSLNGPVEPPEAKTTPQEALRTEVSGLLRIPNIESEPTSPLKMLKFLRDGSFILAEVFPNVT